MRLPDGARVAVIGTGPSGLATAKHALEAGFDVTVYEAGEELGGQWCTGAPHSGVWPGMHTNTSRAMTAFSDFPAPASHPLHPAAEQILAYLHAYADAFGVTPRIRFGTRVAHVERGWTVDGEPFDAVVAASGRFHRPVRPPGFERFGGEVLHSYDYPGRESFRGRRVLVYGNGISALEIAADLASHARVISAFRKPRYVIQKRVGDVASDCQWYTLAGALERRALPPAQWGRRQRERVLRMAGNPADYGAPEPDRDFLVAGIGLCQDYLADVRDGRIACRPAITAIDGRTVTFADGTTARPDALICGTGYAPVVDFPLHLRTFDATDPTRAALGHFFALGPYFPLLELQARWVMAVWSGDLALGEVTADAPVPMDAHNMLALTLSEQLGVAPDPDAFPDLHDELLYGPMLPPRYRLTGPGAQPDAAERLLAQMGGVIPGRDDPALTLEPELADGGGAERERAAAHRR